jgi:hypothetical protein
VDPGDIVGPLYGDQQEYRVLHELVTSGFAGSRVEALRPRLQHLTLDLVDSLPRGAQVDLVETLAVPLPLIVICELLGVPGELHADIRVWSAAIMTDEPALSVPAYRAMAEVFGTLIRRRRTRQDDALLSALVHADVGGGCLGDEQLLSMLILLVVAGQETITSLIGNILAALLHSPGAWKSLAGQDGAVGSAIAEVMRWDPPVRVTAPYLATGPIRLDQEHVIPGGSVIVVNLGAAGRCRRRNGSTAVQPVRRDHCARSRGFRPRAACLPWHLAGADGGDVGDPAHERSVPELRTDRRHRADTACHLADQQCVRTPPRRPQPVIAPYARTHISTSSWRGLPPSLIPNVRYASRTWVDTVRRDFTSALAISGLLIPAATNRATSVWAGVSCSNRRASSLDGVDSPAVPEGCGARAAMSTTAPWFPTIRPSLSLDGRAACVSAKASSVSATAAR